MEDVIFGKNRHWYGGIEPSNMQTFTAKPTETKDGIVVTITAKGPKNTTNEQGQELCTAVGYIVRRGLEDYPKDEFDGELVYHSRTSATIRTITDDDVEGGKVYYYAAFPYSEQGVYNRNRANRAKADLTDVVTYTYLYGYDLDLEDSNPSTRVTYPTDVDNTNYAAAHMDFTAGSFNYGGWNIAPGEKFMPKPCMLKYNGTVDHYLDPDDYGLKEDGTASSVADSSFGANAMMEWPKIYTKRWEENGVYHFRCSDVKIDDDYDCWCNYDINDNEIDHFYTAIYMSTNITSRLRSVSGTKPSNGQILQGDFNLAMANGDDWHIETMCDRLLIQDLLVMMGKNSNGQSVYGTGIGGTTGGNSGSMDSKGLFWGTDDKTIGVKIFGMENWWGNHGRYLAGWIFASSGLKYKITRGTKDGSTVGDYNVNGNGYLDVTGASFSTGTYFLRDFLTTTYGRIPKSTKSGVSSTTYECDAFVLASNRPAPAIVGTSGGSGEGGPFNVSFTSSSDGSGGTRSAALSCKPSKS